MADSPPSTRTRSRSRTRPTAEPTQAATPTARKGSLERRLEEFFSIFSLGFSAMGDEHCAGVISRGTPDLARAWAKLADESPAVRRVLDRLMTGGAWGGVVISTLAIAIPIAEHHNALPNGFINPFGAPQPTPNPRNNGNGNPPARDPFRPDTPPPRATA